MPPIKGRMMGLQLSTSVYSRASKTCFNERKPKESSRCAAAGIPESAEKLQGLRIPDKISRNLPSMQGFGDSTADLIPCLTTDEEEFKWNVTGSVHRRSKSGSYQLLTVCEHRFSGIVWDVGFLRSGDVFVCYGDGVAICDRNLKVQKTLDKIRLAGGVSVMRDGNIVAIDRFNDTINIYSSDGRYISSFQGGKSPMNVAVNRNNFIVVTDVGDKCVRTFSPEGTLLNTVPQKGKGYELQWPLYVQTLSDNSTIVSDVLQRKLFMFDEQGSYVKAFQLKTYGANCVLRPHGICVNENDGCLFVIDNALDTIELFERDDTYVQTVLPSYDGATIKPKVIGVSDDGFLVVGGMTGVVKLFKYFDDCEGDIEITKVEMPSFKAENSTDIKEENVVDLSDEDENDCSDVKTETTETGFAANEMVIIID